MKTAAAWTRAGQREEDFPSEAGMHRAVAPAGREAPHFVRVARPAVALEPDNDTYRMPAAAPFPFQFRPQQSAAAEDDEPAERGADNYDWDATSGDERPAVPAWLAANRSAPPAGRLMLRPKRASAWRWGLPLIALVIAAGGAGLFFYGKAAFPTDRAGAPKADVAAPTETGEAVPAPTKVKTAAVHETATTPAAAAQPAAATPPATTTTPKEAAVVVKPAATAVQPLPPNDARWARTEDAAPQPAPARKADEVAMAAKPDTPSAPPAQAAASDNTPAAASSEAPAAAPSAFIRPAKPPAAERQAPPQTRSAAPEEKTGENDLPGVDTDILPAAGKPAAKAAPFVATRRASVSTAVKMHAGPGNGSHVIGVIPSGGAVAVANCDDWCRVSYKGREGWIYKEFVHGSGSGHKSATAAAKAATSPVTTAAIKPAAASDKPVPIEAPHKRGR